ncbi:MAG: hypothetical protein OJJ54_24970 [Pseudonocardia sp.]|nr:hypothetical protein [Pseudonocardia sp.]
MTQRRRSGGIPLADRLEHIEAVRRVAVSVLLPLDPRAQLSAREVLDFICAHIAELPADAGRMSVRVAVDYIARGTHLAPKTVRKALAALDELHLIRVVRSTPRAQRVVDATKVEDPRRAEKRAPQARTASVWTISTDLREQAAVLPPAEPNFWATEEGAAFRRRGAAITEDTAAREREARERRAVRSSLRHQRRPEDDAAVDAELRRLAPEPGISYPISYPNSCPKCYPNSCPVSCPNSYRVSYPQAQRDSLRSSVVCDDGLAASVSDSPGSNERVPPTSPRRHSTQASTSGARPAEPGAASATASGTPAFPPGPEDPWEEKRREVRALMAEREARERAEQ